MTFLMFSLCLAHSPWIVAWCFLVVFGLMLLGCAVVAGVLMGSCRVAALLVNLFALLLFVGGGVVAEAEGLSSLFVVAAVLLYAATEYAIFALCRRRREARRHARCRQQPPPLPPLP